MVVAPAFSATACAILNVPFAKGGNSKTPMGPFQTMVRARRDLFGKCFDRLRADIERHHVVGDRLAGPMTFGRRAGLDAVGDHVIGRQQELYLVRFRLLQKFAGQFDFVFLDQDFADGLPCALRNV